MALYLQWRFLTGKAQKTTAEPSETGSSTCEEPEPTVLGALDQNQQQEPVETLKQGKGDSAKAMKSDTITLTGSQLKSLIKEYTKVCVREELGELLETLLASKSVRS